MTELFSDLYYHWFQN